MTHDEEDVLRHEAELINNLIKASDVKVIHKEYPVFEESNEWQIIDMGDGARAVFHTASIHITECSCGYKSKSPFDMLNHLVKAGLFVAPHIIPGPPQVGLQERVMG